MSRVEKWERKKGTRLLWQVFLSLSLCHPASLFSQLERTRKKIDCNFGWSSDSVNPSAGQPPNLTHFSVKEPTWRASFSNQIEK